MTLVMQRLQFSHPSTLSAIFLPWRCSLDLNFSHFYKWRGFQMTKWMLQRKLNRTIVLFSLLCRSSSYSRCHFHDFNKLVLRFIFYHFNSNESCWLANSKVESVEKNHKLRKNEGKAKHIVHKFWQTTKEKII